MSCLSLCPLLSGAHGHFWVITDAKFSRKLNFDRRKTTAPLFVFPPQICSSWMLFDSAQITPFQKGGTWGIWAYAGAPLALATKDILKAEKEDSNHPEFL